jgi:hypothetical protein
VRTMSNQFQRGNRAGEMIVQIRIQIFHLTFDFMYFTGSRDYFAGGFETRG